MPGHVLNIDWLNENALRNYPVVDGASLVAANGLAMPVGLIVDINLPVPIGAVEPGNLFIKQVVGFSTGLAVELADRTAPNTTLASASLFITNHQQFDSYTLTGQGALLGSIGRITFGDPLTLLEAAKTVYDFTSVPDNSRLVAHATRPYIRGVTAIRVVDSSTAESVDLTDVVELVQGTNIVLQVEPGRVVINSSLLDPGDPDDDCGCGDGDDDGDGEPIYTLSNVEPDENGNIDIVGQDCTSIVTGEAQLEIVDVCSTPCCDCEQLDVLYQGLQLVETEAGRLQEVSEQLRGRLDNMQTVMANSQLNPPGGGEASEESGGTYWFLPIGPGGNGGVWVGG